MLLYAIQRRKLLVTIPKQPWEDCSEYDSEVTKESHSFLPVKTALEQSEQGNCTKPDCNQYPGSFLIHGSSPLVSSTISSLIIAHFFSGSLQLTISKYLANLHHIF